MNTARKYFRKQLSSLEFKQSYMEEKVKLDIGEIETDSLCGNAKFIALIERSRDKQKAEGGISREEMRRRLEKPKPTMRGK